MTSLQAHREFYAQVIAGGVGCTDPRLIDAFASIERERFIGRGPWLVAAGEYVRTPTDDPVILYQDIVVAIAPERGINNGQPSLHAQCLAACAIVEGETVIHVGAGTGYYTAILAKLVGDSGAVIAYEVERDIAKRAETLLSAAPNVTVVCGSADNELALPKADVVYVNAGASHPLEAWLDALGDHGRLLFPLTPPDGFGGMVCVTRVGPTSYRASVLMRASFMPCRGARDDVCAAAVDAAFESGSFQRVKSLRRHSKPDSTAWCAGVGWWLSTSEPVESNNNVG